MQRCLVLGDGTFQRALIHDLLRQGIEVHVVSKWPARTEPHNYTRHQVDYQDIGRVATLFSDLGCDFILTAGTDAALPTIGKINARFGLPGLDEPVILLFEDKTRYKQKLAAAGVDVPKFKPVENANDLSSFHGLIAPRQVMLKKRKGSGSSGLIHLQDRYLTVLDGFAFSDFFAEELIPGQEYGGDMIVADGTLLFYWPTLKSSNGACVPFMHLLFIEVGEIRILIADYLQQVVDALALDKGLFNVDIIVDRDKPYLIDISPRIGGNCIPDLNLRGWGVNEWQVLTDLHQGRKPMVEPCRQPIPHGVYVLHSERAGVMRSHTPLRGEEIAEVYYAKHPGDQVHPFSEGSRHVGYVIFSAATDEALRALATRIAAHQWFVLEA